MNLTLNTRWMKNDHRTYLIVTISATDDNTEATASQTYLDIQMPEGVCIRHIGNLPGDGHGNTIGIDIPDLEAGSHQNIVFKVKSLNEAVAAPAPELHLHWIDSATGDLLERHQTGTPMPTEPTGANEDLTEIVSAARSEHKHSRRPERRHESTREKTSMSTEPTKPSRHCGRRTRHQWHEQGEDSMETTDQRIQRHLRRGRRHERAAKRELGGHAGRHARGAWKEARGYRKHSGNHIAGETRHESRRSGKGHLYRMIDQMQQQIDDMERKMHHMRRKARLQGMTPDQHVETHREIIRTRRIAGTGRISTRGHRGRHMHNEGRRMGRMMHRAFAASRADRDDQQPEA